jgi:hypothetical protein
MKPLLVNRSSKELLDLKDAIALVGDLCDAVDRHVLPLTEIPPEGWPKDAGSTRQAYEQARQETTLSVRAMNAAAKAATGALHQVARNYDVAEKRSTVGAHTNVHSLLNVIDEEDRQDTGAAIGMKLPVIANSLPAVPSVIANTVYAFKAVHVGPSTDRLDMWLKRLRAPAALFMAASILATNATRVWPNLKDPAPFGQAEANWDSSSRTLKSALDEGDGYGLEKMLSLKDWHGEAKDAFDSYMRGEFVPATRELTSLLSAMDNYQANQDRIALATLALAALATYPLGAPYAAAIATGYFFLVEGNLSLLKNQGTPITEQMRKVTTSANTLAGRCLTSRPKPEGLPPENRLLQVFSKDGLGDEKKWREGFLPGA